MFLAVHSMVHAVTCLHYMLRLVLNQLHLRLSQLPKCVCETPVGLSQPEQVPNQYSVYIPVK